jgi:perosamine synthetase
MTVPKATRPTIPFLQSHFPSGIPDELSAVFASGYVGAGDLVRSFENALQEYLGAPYILSTSSCTAALTLAYVDAGISPGSTVLSTPMTCAATNIPLLHLGAKIRWLDVDPDSGNVTATSIAAGLNRHSSARAVVIMDWGGTPCDYASIIKECTDRNVPLILDAAQSFGSLYADKRYPADIDYVCYSFGPTKLLSSVEGGAVASKRDRDPMRMKTLRWYGIKREERDSLRFWEYGVDELGFRFVFNNVFAAVGLRALSSIEFRLTHHRQLAALYDEQLRGIQGLQVAKRPLDSKPNFWLYTVIVQEREQLLLKLHSEGIHAATPHRRNDRLLASWSEPENPETLAGIDSFDHNYLCLPIGPWVSADDVNRISCLIKAGW